MVLRFLVPSKVESDGFYGTRIPALHAREQMGRESDTILLASDAAMAV